MNRSRKLLLLSLPLLLCVLVVWTRWRRDNPIPTEHDLEMRRLFLSASSTFIVPMQASRHGSTYQLTTKDKQEIAPHLWFEKRSSPTPFNEAYCLATLRWSYPAPKRNWGHIFLSEQGLQDPCEFFPGEEHGASGYLWFLRPQSSLYLRRWFATHPKVVQHLDLKLK